MLKTGIVLAALLLFVTINSTHYFLGVSKASIVEWIVFNACAPSSMVYLVGFALFLACRDRTVMHVAVLPMLFFGGLGLYLFPWSGFNLIAQLSHVLMVLNVAWALGRTFSTADYRPAFLGMLIGTILFSPFITYQQMYAYTHREASKRVLGVDVSDFGRKFGSRAVPGAGSSEVSAKAP